MLHISLLFAISIQVIGEELRQAAANGKSKERWSLFSSTAESCLHLKQAKIRGVKSCSQSSDCLHINDLRIYTEHRLLNFDKSYF